MYGKSERDPVVDYYDLAFGVTGEAERDFYVDKMRRYGGPVLDLAGGTGRFTIEAAMLGLDVTYVDASPGMHTLLSGKLKALNPEIRNHIKTERADMAAFTPDRQFALVICVDAFFHNLTSSAARRTLTTISNALGSDGAFFFNIHYTTPPFLCYAASEKAASWNERGRYPLPNSDNTLQVDQSLAIDYASQTITTKLRFRETDKKDNVLVESLSEWQSRYYGRDEIEYLLELCGLRVASVQGTYDGGPVAEGSQLIYECRALTS